MMMMIVAKIALMKTFVLVETKVGFYFHIHNSPHGLHLFFDYSYL